jgi:WD40 repeat protein
VQVGSTPFGVAIDTDRDLAVVTNSGDGTVSIVDLTGATDGSAGTLTGPNVSVGTTPEGIATIPRLGLAFVANNGSNTMTAVDVTRANPPVSISTCPSGTCVGPIGVAVDPDNPRVLVTSGNASVNPSQGNIDLFTVTPPITTTVPTTPTVLAGPTITLVDEDPIAVALDPTLNVGAAASEIVQTTVGGPTTGALDVFTPGNLNVLGNITPLEVPSAVLFDPLNQVFIVGQSLENNLLFVAPSIDPGTPISTTTAVAINPTSLDYNFQTSTLVTVNAASNTISVLDYLCPPPPIGPITCSPPQARQILALTSSQNRSTLLQFAVAIDPKLNLAVLVDQANSRVLLFPLPN